MGGSELNCINVKSEVLNNKMNQSQHKSLRLSSFTSESDVPFGFEAALVLSTAQTIQLSPPPAIRGLSSAFWTERHFAVLASRRKLRMKSWRNFTTNKVACFTRIERHSTPLLVSGRLGRRVSRLDRSGAGFAPVPPWQLGMFERAGSGVKSDGCVLSASRRNRSLRSVRLEKEFVAQQESRFVT